MTRNALLIAALALSACAPTVPDSGEGVGFEEYGDHRGYRSQRDAVLNGGVATTPILVPDRAAAATPPASGASPVDPATTVATTTITPTKPVNNPTISDENDFSAVSNRQSIESDAERLRAQREAYEVIAPTTVPRRSGTSGPNIVEYALSTSNPMGQKAYRRGIVTSQQRFARNCSGYASPDLAQEAFLKAGGPERDKLGIDPDGDGYACAWDPRPFRRLGGASNG